MNKDCNHFWIHPSVDEPIQKKKCKNCNAYKEINVAALVKDFEKLEKVDWARHRKAAQRARHGQ